MSAHSKYRHSGHFWPNATFLFLSFRICISQIPASILCLELWTAFLRQILWWQFKTGYCQSLSPVYHVVIDGVTQNVTQSFSSYVSCWQSKVCESLCGLLNTVSVEATTVGLLKRIWPAAVEITNRECVSTLSDSSLALEIVLRKQTVLFSVGMCQWTHLQVVWLCNCNQTSCWRGGWEADWQRGKAARIFC
jgi:hypothetical protein